MFTRFALAPVAAAILALPSHAQQPAVATDAVLSYTPADFASSRPATAKDMIDRLPGFQLEGGDQVRGFAGAAGNVLIDGQRPTIKTDSLQDTLGRIPIEQVLRIDVIRGGAPGIDMQGRTVIANVIRKSTDSFQQVITATVQGFIDTRNTYPSGSWQVSRRAGDHQFDIQVGRSWGMDDSSGYGKRTRVDYPSGTTLVQRSKSFSAGPNDTIRGNYKGPMFGGTLSLNGLLGADRFKNDQVLTGPDERYIDKSGNERGEIGVNYKRKLTPELESESLILVKQSQGRGDSTGEAGTETAEFNVRAQAGERIGRSVLRYTMTPELTLEGAGEVAFNFRDQSIAFSQNGVPVALPSANVRVEELRSELFGQASWHPIKDITLEAGVRVEQSTITQSGDNAQEREFTYSKPRFAASWAPSADNQLRMRVEREVGQLNFQAFASNVNLTSNVLSAGNSNLKPDQRWVYEIAGEQRFWNTGALVVTLRHEDIEDVSDVFPFSVPVDANNDGIPDDANSDGIPDTTLVAGPGNIGNGTNNVFEVSLTLPLEKLGIKGGEFKVNGSWQDPRVRDPLTGEKRMISGERPHDVTFEYRHDFPAQNLTAGLFYFTGWSEREFLLGERRNLRLRNYYEAFLEWKPDTHFLLRGEISNFDRYSFDIERIVYDDVRGSSDVDYVETESRRSQPMFMLRGRWTF